jgi:hypothetical protein
LAERIDNNWVIFGLGALGALFIAAEQHENWKRIQFKALFHEKQRIIKGLDEVEKGLMNLDLELSTYRKGFA